MTYKDPASIESQEDAESRLERVMIALDVAVFAVFIRRIKRIKPDGSISEIYAVMPDDMSQIERLVDTANAKLKDEINSIFTAMADSNDEWARQFYEASGISQTKALDHAELRSIYRAGVKDAERYVDDRVRTSVIGIADGKEVKYLKDEYRAVISDSATGIVTGANTKENAILDATKRLSDSGLKVVYPNIYRQQILNDAGEVVGTRIAYRASRLTRDLYASVRTNVMDAYRKTLSDLRIAQGQEFGADGVEITAHVPCAADHEEYQGRQFTNEQYATIQAGLSRQLVDGANCKHIAYPIILGVSPEKYTEAQLREMEHESNRKVQITGLSGKTLTMDRYKASQYQRQLENSIRKNNIDKYLREVGDAEIKTINATIKAKKAAYNRICEQASLPPQYDRMKAYTL